MKVHSNIFFLMIKRWTYEQKFFSVKKITQRNLPNALTPSRPGWRQVANWKGSLVLVTSKPYRYEKSLSPFNITAMKIRTQLDIRLHIKTGFACSSLITLCRGHHHHTEKLIILLIARKWNTYGLKFSTTRAPLYHQRHTIFKL